MHAVNQSGEIIKIIRLENGYNVAVFDPVFPPTEPGKAPCQGAVQWWKTYTFLTAEEAALFVTEVLKVSQ
jgi:hypothetical protein